MAQAEAEKVAAIPVSIEKCELDGPYECSGCGGHMKLDATFLLQCDESPSCPYCQRVLIIPAS